MKYKLCIWDLDGTLLNTLPTLNYYDNLALKHYGFNPISIKQSAELIKYSIQTYYSKLLEYGNCEDVERFVDDILDYDLKIYQKNPLYLTLPYDDINETINRLNNLGVINIVLSNKPIEIANTLVNYFFKDDIKKVYAQTKTTISKPNKGCVDKILNDFNIPFDKMIIIGDTEVDLLTANNHNIDSIAVKWGYSDINKLKKYKPNYLISKPIEIIDIVKEKNNV